MLRLIGVESLIEPLHPAGNVIGLVRGVVEDGEGGDDPNGSNQNQRHHRGPRMTLRKAMVGGAGGPATSASFTVTWRFCRLAGIYFESNIGKGRRTYSRGGIDTS